VQAREHQHRCIGKRGNGGCDVTRQRARQAIGKGCRRDDADTNEADKDRDPCAPVHRFFQDDPSKQCDIERCGKGNGGCLGKRDDRQGVEEAASHQRNQDGALKAALHRPRTWNSKLPAHDKETHHEQGDQKASTIPDEQNLRGAIGGRQMFDAGIHQSQDRDSDQHRTHSPARAHRRCRRRRRSHGRMGGMADLGDRGGGFSHQASFQYRPRCSKALGSAFGVIKLLCASAKHGIGF
jgi:hypothetical protein